jgi:hypothetical protein
VPSSAIIVGHLQAVDVEISNADLRHPFHTFLPTIAPPTPETRRKSPLTAAPNCPITNKRGRSTSLYASRTLMESRASSVIRRVSCSSAAAPVALFGREVSRAGCDVPQCRGLIGPQFPPGAGTQRVRRTVGELFSVHGATYRVDASSVRLEPRAGTPRTDRETWPTLSSISRRLRQRLRIAIR